ncbi:MAG TPA: penicillin acylase family protein [Flavisolibacter sp.]|nr:penicillin acylase family protein [Flavisolibacter sp.]
MRQLLFVSITFCIACSEQKQHNPSIKKYEEQAARVTIIRDTWGIPHVYGKTDADAVFGLMYAQCEEAFEKVERAYIERLGRTAEIDGENALYTDLLTRLICDTASAIKGYDKSPLWMKNLLHAFADGVNYYLYKNPRKKPLLLHHFEAWYPLLFTDGAYVSLKTGGLSMEDVRRMYDFSEVTSFQPTIATALKGSNAFAIAPLKTANNKALLYINPHVSFDFRMEAHMVSEEGLNAYGAVTWGQFFVFQGFNERCGWMHTSSMADAADIYENELLERDGKVYTVYDGVLQPVSQKEIAFALKKQGSKAHYNFTAFYTHHGPVAGRSKAGKLLSLKILPPSLNSLAQSWQRTKAKSFTEFKNTMQLYANATTNTMYADKEGNIAYWHGNFIPKRDTAYNWTRPVDGTTSKTAWKGAHSLEEIVHFENPAQGFIQNCNSTPFSASGINSINNKPYPAYMAPEGENFRSRMAIKELETHNSYTLDKMIALGYNRYLAAFDSLLPPLFDAYHKLAVNDPLRKGLQEPVARLQGWNKRSDVSSAATTLAIEWAYYLIQKEGRQISDEEMSHQIKWMTALVKNTAPKKLLQYLNDIVSYQQNIYGTWQVLWGDVNRYQKKSTGKPFSDSEASLPVGLASAFFGSLPAFEPAWNNTGKGYGYAGNSFVAAVEFGEKIKAKAVMPGGQSFDPASKHFSDQAELYISGKLRDVFFYRVDVEMNKERVYNPGN